MVPELQKIGFRINIIAAVSIVGMVASLTYAATLRIVTYDRSAVDVVELKALTAVVPDQQKRIIAAERDIKDLQELQRNHDKDVTKLYQETFQLRAILDNLVKGSAIQVPGQRNR